MIRILDPLRGVKPLDFGYQGTVGSVDRLGRLIALNMYHETEGYVSFSVAPPFAEDQRYQPENVRRYRAGLAKLDGWGPVFDVGIEKEQAALLEDAIPQITLEFVNGGRATMTILAVENGAIQCWEFDGIAPTAWQGSLSVQRCAYTQLTEGGPLAPASKHNHLHFANGTLQLENAGLGWCVQVDGLPMGGHFDADSDLPIDFHVGGDERQTVCLSMACGKTLAEAKDLTLGNQTYMTPEGFAALLKARQAEWHQTWQAIPDNLLLRRALIYGHWMAIPVQDDAQCILTDHMLLPLSWNRDAYFVAKALLNWGVAHYATVRGHLVWMFEVAERTHFEWGRCYLANGRQKDSAYQLDQQLFPLLELCDYVEVTGDRDLVERLQKHIAPIVEQLLERKARHAWLFPTDETPADDPVAFDYHFSSHVLLWHTFEKLHTVLSDQGYDEIARHVHVDCYAYFVGENRGETCFVYATDGQGHFNFYHDANDTPLVLAPLWGFTTINDPIWQATIRFAFSEANHEGVYDGHLGSVHTRAPWPLGDIQAWLVAQLTHDNVETERLHQELEKAAAWDGALPEAYDPTSYAVLSRYWFAWPGVFYASLLMEGISSK